MTLLDGDSPQFIAETCALLARLADASCFTLTHFRWRCFSLRHADVCAAFSRLWLTHAATLRSWHTDYWAWDAAVLLAECPRLVNLALNVDVAHAEHLIDDLRTRVGEDRRSRLKSLQLTYDNTTDPNVFAVCTQLMHLLPQLHVVCVVRS